MNEMTDEQREAKISEVLEGLDGAEIFGVISIVADARDVDLVATLEEIVDSGYDDACLDEDQMMVADLILHSQSDQDRALRSLLEAARLDQERIEG